MAPILEIMSVGSFRDGKDRDVRRVDAKSASFIHAPDYQRRHHTVRWGPTEGVTMTIHYLVSHFYCKYIFVNHIV